MIWKHSKNDKSLQKYHSIHVHQPQNDEFFRWTLLSVSLCEIMDTVCYPLHPAPWLLKGTLWVRELRSICTELDLNWSFLLRVLLSHFQSCELQRCHKQAGRYISPGHHVADTKRQILVRFSSNLVAIFILCSLVVRLKRKGNYFKWIEIVISSLVLSLFVYMLMRDASLKQRIPSIIRISIFGAFSAGKKCAL